MFKNSQDTDIVPSDVTNPQLEVGSSASTYESYAGQTYTITFPSSAGTVYGGTLTIHQDGTGTLVVTEGKVTYDGSTNVWTQQSTGGSIFYSALDIKKMDDYIGAIICDKLQTKSKHTAIGVHAITAYKDTNNTYPTQNWVYIQIDSSITSTSALNEWLSANPLTVVYELATPIEYDLTPVEVTTLLGLNNVWADTGNIIELNYAADTKLYVDQVTEKLTATQKLMELIITTNREDEMKATKAYSTGDLLIVNGTLYKATTSIANGATLTVGTNVTATTVAAELALLA